MIRVWTFLLLIAHAATGQKREVAITIDDLPNVRIFKDNGFGSRLLKELNHADVPAAIFVNERNIYQNEFVAENYAGLIEWLKNPRITGGNHTFSHINYGNVPAEAFQDDVVRGEIITREMLLRRQQELKYFRFPFNALGKDSTAHREIEHFLHKRNYIVTPFTIESEDWMYSTVYDEALQRRDLDKARSWGLHYVATTVALFEYYEKLCQKRFGRNIRHIYLCHDNQLNTDYLPELIARLRQKGYAFIDLDTALLDKVYQARDYYDGNFGFSWIYRWEADGDKRKYLLREEPDNKELHDAYQKLKKLN